VGELDSKISDSLKEQFMMAYPVFSICAKGQLTPSDFLSHIVGLGEDGENLLRAALVFEQSQKCMKCEPTVAMTLLCSAIEAMTPERKQIFFVPWLLKNRLKELEMKSRSELKEAIDSAFNDFLKIPHRSGAFYNFRQFLLDNCPKSFRVGPFKMIDNSCLPFNEAISFIYDEFRSKFIHEAMPSVSSENLSKNENMYRQIEYLGGFYFLKKGKKWMILKPSEGLIWFSQVVKESLYHYLLNPDKPIDSAI
jgi:hypothetical protein